MQGRDQGSVLGGVFLKTAPVLSTVNRRGRGDFESFGDYGFPGVPDTDETKLSYGDVSFGYSDCLTHSVASLLAPRVNRLHAVRETRVQSLGREDPLEKGMATHSGTLA